MKRYIRVYWEHQDPDSPSWLLSEVGDYGVELRKVEIYRDGRMDHADEKTETGNTSLSWEPLPSFEEIQDQSGFELEVIPRREFEEAWDKARTQASGV